MSCGGGSAAFVEIDSTGLTADASATDRNETRTVTCGANETLAVNVTGVGILSVHVTDSAGETVYRTSVVPGTSDRPTQISGAAGTWTLLVSPYADFAGTYDAKLTCD